MTPAGLAVVAELRRGARGAPRARPGAGGRAAARPRTGPPGPGSGTRSAGSPRHELRELVLGGDVVDVLGDRHGAQGISAPGARRDRMAHGRSAARCWASGSRSASSPCCSWSYTAITLGTAHGLARRGRDLRPGLPRGRAVGVLLQGLVAHCVNEIADWRSGTDRDPSPRVISGGSKVIASGLLGPRALGGDRGGGGGGGGGHRARGGGHVGLGARWPTGSPASAGACSTRCPRCGPPTGPSAARRRLRLHLGLHDGRYVLQTGALTGGVALAGIAYAASCVAMLMMHHYLDRSPTASARRRRPPRSCCSGRAGRRYAVPVGGHRAGLGGAPDRARRRRLRHAAGASAALVVHARRRPGRPRARHPRRAGRDPARHGRRARHGGASSAPEMPGRSVPSRPRCPSSWPSRAPRTAT